MLVEEVLSIVVQSLFGSAGLPTSDIFRFLTRSSRNEEVGVIRARFRHAAQRRLHLPRAAAVSAGDTVVHCAAARHVALRPRVRILHSVHEREVRFHRKEIPR